MRFNRFYYKKFFLREKEDVFKICNIQHVDNHYIIECVDNKKNFYQIQYNESIHKLYENKLLKPFNDIKKYFIKEEISTGDAGVGGTGGQFSGDFYAPGDARNLYGGIPPKIQKRNLWGMENTVLKKKRKKIKKKNAKKRKT